VTPDQAGPDLAPATGAPDAQPTPLSGRSTWAQVWMDTIVTIGLAVPEAAAARWASAVQRAFGWFERVEAVCSRFDRDSEVGRLVGRAGEPVPVSPILRETLRLGLALAEATGGAFDPTVGGLLETRGFDREYRTGARIRSRLDPSAPTSFRDVHLDPSASTVTLDRPLLLDLGALAKGLAVDLAARELAAAPGGVIDAGGDCLVWGHPADDRGWRVGVRHPRQADRFVAVLGLGDGAVCTAGDYARRPAHGGRDHHIVDPRRHGAVTVVASATVVAPTAMVADALSTAAMVLGPVDGPRLLAACGVEGLLVTGDLELAATPGLDRYLLEPLRVGR
jgi:FAD:protein FMN transferase